MTVSNTPRIFSLLCLALSVAGQWTGNYNTTQVPRGQDPADHCWIQSLDPAKGASTAVYPCTCTGGKVAPDCNWKQAGAIYNSVRDATCKCARERNLNQQPEELDAFGRSQPSAVTACICDPTNPKGEPGADGLIVPDTNCWCPSVSLAKNSGLTEAKEAAPEAPATVDAAAVKKCRDDFLKSSIVKENACSQLPESTDSKFTDSLQRELPSCTPALLAEVCKTI
ncbi:uncharacterized protein BBA_08622 [Beauveria bassiana ARSEF 2860]|uniref:Uncharacterized protein n=1 Tax=Beauveria bassiana (strain ARSEF 2860) TaxID=655819 RepID=J5JFJ8_BEAB2|nr:uncharacterized protein BBA_08622 [Beauveria bassiana ARSEF 2860]EJP62401.1 hypothetical protein BBA_08622 [Beauveria bassiana ARSEF 2860]